MFQHLHKARTNNFGNMERSTLVTKKIDQMNKLRKQKRDDIMFIKRNIIKEVHNDEKIKQNKPINDHNLKVQERVKMLQKFKEEKEKRKKAEKAKAKPVFKVCHVSPIKYTSLQNTNKLAPNNYEFKPPKNVKPISVNNQIKAAAAEGDNFKRVTRSQTAKLNILKNDKPKNKILSKEIINSRIKLPGNKKVKTPMKTVNMSKKITTKNMNSNKIAKKQSNSVKQEAAIANEEQQANNSTHKVAKELINMTDTANTNAMTESENTNLEVEELSSNLIQKTVSASSAKTEYLTPQKKDQPTTYISPFVTILRGKNSARKEFHHRRSRGGTLLSTPDVSPSISNVSDRITAATTTSAGAAYFRQLLNDHICRIKLLCEQWETIKNDENTPEEGRDMINTAIGQSQLLVNKKFQQFRGLIDKCDSNDVSDSSVITNEDLHGFWDMIYIQVNNIDKRFENLTLIKENNWTEVIPDNKRVTKKKAKSKKKQVESRLKDVLKAARKKKLNKTPNRKTGTPSNVLKSANRSSKRKSRTVNVMDEDSSVKPNTEINKSFNLISFETPKTKGG